MPLSSSSVKTVYSGTSLNYKWHSFEHKAAICVCTWKLFFCDSTMKVTFHTHIVIYMVVNFWFFRSLW
jgi:hypothetical protein